MSLLLSLKDWHFFLGKMLERNSCKDRGECSEAHDAEHKMMKQRSDYYRAIANTFIKERGAPFILSSGDINQIRAWENKGIPLHTVTEGIRLFFSRHIGRSRSKRGVLPLSACAVSVERAYDMFLSRKVGSSGKRKKRENKYGAAGQRIDLFLKKMPMEAKPLESLILEARDILQSNNVDEDRLEILENMLEKRMVALIHPAEIERRRKRTEEDYPELDKEERERIALILAFRDLREKVGIPYLSLHYYE